MSTQTSSAAELRQEVEAVSRRLEQKQAAHLAALKGTMTEDGKRAILPHQAVQIREGEEECRKLTDQLNALKMD
jgi:hypothetical protein